MRRVRQERIDLQEVVKNLNRAKAIREEQCGEVMGPVALMLHHMKAFGMDLVRSIGNHEKTRNNDAPHEGRGSTVRSLAQRRLEENDLGQGRSSEEQRRSTRNCRNKH